MDNLTILMAYILIIAPLMIFTYIIYKIFEKARLKRYKKANEIARRRRYERDAEMSRIGIRLMNTPSIEQDKPEPIRKVCGAFADMAEVWN